MPKTDFLNIKFNKVLKSSLDDKIQYLADGYFLSKNISGRKFDNLSKKFDKLYESINSKNDKYKFLLYCLNNPHTKRYYSNFVHKYLEKFTINDFNYLIKNNLIENESTFFTIVDIIDLNKSQKNELLQYILKEGCNFFLNDYKAILMMIDDSVEDFDAKVKYIEGFCEKYPSMFSDYSNNPYAIAISRENNLDIEKIINLYNQGLISNEDIMFIFKKSNFLRDLSAEKIFEKVDEITKYIADEGKNLISIIASRSRKAAKYIVNSEKEGISLHDKALCYYWGYTFNERCEILNDFLKNHDKYSSKEISDFICVLLSDLELSQLDEMISKYVIKSASFLTKEDLSSLIVNVIRNSIQNPDYSYNNKNTCININKKDEKVIWNLLNKYSNYILKKDNSVVIKKLNDLDEGLSTESNLNFILKNSNIINLDSIKIDINSLNNPKFVEYFLNELGVGSEEKDKYLSMAKYLLKVNADIFKTLNTNLLTNEYFDMFSKIDDNGNVIYPSLRIIGRYPELQENILNIKKDNLDVFKKMYKEIVNDNYDYTVLLKKVLNNFEKYDSLLNDVSEKIANYSETDQKEIIDLLVFIISKNDKNINANNIDELKTLSTEITDKIKRTDYQNLDDIKENFLICKYGLTLQEAKSYIKRYASNLDFSKSNIDEDDKIIISKLEEIKEIINCDNIDTIKSKINALGEFKIDFKESSIFEAKIRKMYAKILNKSLLNFDNMQKSNDNFGTGLDVYFAFSDEHPNFNMLITALGAYSGYVRPKNYKNDWLRASDSVHAFCSSLISNQMMGTAKLEYACLGFSQIPESSYLLSAPFDISSKNANVKMDTALEMPDDRVKFLPPNLQIDYTRHTHNELVIDRLIDTGKLSPSYSVFIVEEFDKEKIKRWNLKICTQEEKSEYELYSNAIQAAKDFNIPLVIVERKRIREYERNEINKMFNDFKKSYDSNLLFDILTRFENNRAGSRNYWNLEGFTIHDIGELLSNITEVINELVEKDPIKALDCIGSLQSWIYYELTEKVSRKSKKITSKELGFSPEKLKTYIENVKKIVEEKSKFDYINNAKTVINEPINNQILEEENQITL